MKIVRTLTPDEVLTELPPGFLLAFGSPDAFYCWRCDGLRLPDHACICCVCGNTVCGDDCFTVQWTKHEALFEADCCLPVTDQ